MKKSISFFLLVPAALALALVTSCAADLGPSTDSTTKGSISGYARYSGQVGSGGIVGSAESVSSGRTVKVRLMDGKTVSAAKAIAAQATTGTL